MKKKLLFIFAVLTLRGSPQSGDIDTLYNLHSIQFFPENYRTFIHCTIYNLSLQSPVSSWQKVKVYDLLGNEIATLVDEYKSAGNYEEEFKSSVGSLQLANGIYYYQLRAGEFIQTKKMIFIR